MQQQQQMQMQHQIQPQQQMQQTQQQQAQPQQIQNMQQPGAGQAGMMGGQVMNSGQFSPYPLKFLFKIFLKVALLK